MIFRFDHRRPEFGVSATVFLLFSYGVWLRLYGVSGFPLWNDEVWRAILMSSGGPLINDGTATALSAPGYMLVGRWLSYVSNSELTLKMTSFVPGVLSIPLAGLIGWSLTGRAIPSVIFALFVALNQELIRYSRELKPYAFEVFAHMLLLWLFVKALDTKKPRDVFWLNAVTGILPFFALPIVFALPAVYCMSWVLLRDAPRGTIYRLAALQFVGCAVTAFLYWFNWRFAPVAGIRTAFFAEAFFDASRDSGYLSWLGVQLRDICAFSLTLANAKPMRGLALLAWLVLPALISVRLFRARYLNKPVLAYMSAVFGAVLVVNAMGQWPFGAVRVDLFLVPYAVALLGVLYGVFSPVQSRALRIGILIVFLVPWLRGFHILSVEEIAGLNPPKEDLPSAMRSVCEDKLLENATVVVYGATDGAFRYYTEYHDELAKSCGQTIKKLTRIVYVPSILRDPSGNAKMQQAAETANRIIILFSHEDLKELQAVEEFFKGKRVMTSRILAEGTSYALVFNAT